MNIAQCAQLFYLFTFMYSLMDISSKIFNEKRFFCAIEDYNNE